MKRFAPGALLAMCLLVVGCTESESSPEATVTETSVPTSTSSTIPPTTTSTLAIPTLTIAEEEEPPEFTEFTNSTVCEPAAEDANLQVIQAFVTAYSDHNEERLAELVSDPVTVDDLSGIPHLGVDHWTEISAWANQGWDVDDRFELTRLVMYDGGSVFDVDRSNDVLRDNGFESIHHSWKVHSSNCSISHMVLYLPSEKCLFWEAFADALAEGTEQPISEPESCTG